MQGSFSFHVFPRSGAGRFLRGTAMNAISVLALFAGDADTGSRETGGENRAAVVLRLAREEISNL
jgi:hypothetical protein